MSALQQMFEVTRKELTHVLRDRRTVVSTQLYALVGPVLLVATISAMAGDPDRASKIGVVGQAADLTRALEVAGFELQPVSEPPLSDEALKPLDAVLVIPDDYQRKREARRSVALTLFAGKAADSKRAAKRVSSVIRAHGARIGAIELLRRGVAPTVTQPVRVSTVDVSESSASDLFAKLLLMYIILAPFLAGTGAAIDTATGERERGTLALMRLQPLSPTAWVAGKWLVVAAFAWTGLIVTTVVSVLTLRAFAPTLCSGLALGPANIGLLCIAGLPVALMASAISFGLALQAKSTMEAQTRLTFISIVPVGLGLVSAIGRVPDGWAIPVLHELTALPDWIAGGSFPTVQTVASAAVGLVLIASILTWSGRRIVSEAYWVA